MIGPELDKRSYEITGMVQGVGFRPFVYNLALRLGLSGFVLNHASGVRIEASGSTEALDELAEKLIQETPPLAQITGIIQKELPSLLHDQIDTGSEPDTDPDQFTIRPSRPDSQPTTLIPPDTCICADCLKEMFDPANRRYLYPFTNCTNCGPRFTIIRSLPYDRPTTTMSDFVLCPPCRREYENPADRRFHAQPNACAACGPALQLLDHQGKPVDEDPVLATIRLLRQGRIVAIKGLGGFHLAVSATNQSAVKRLRERKHREEKPLAVMVGHTQNAKELIEISPLASTVLKGSQRPILLAPRFTTRPGDSAVISIADAVAPANPYLGLMLPYTPLHYILFFHPDAGGDFHNGACTFDALVMTSANLSEEPITKDNNEAVERLQGIADGFLVSNRTIHVRCDDSVVTTFASEINILRRSRGFTPVPLFLKDDYPTTLAFGGELKNTLCLLNGNRAFISQHIGDLAQAPAMGFFKEAVDHFTSIFDLTPRIFAYDQHPEYLSTKYFNNLWQTCDPSSSGAVGVQHHHAHIAAVMAEHQQTEPVIGFSMDGAGLGPDGTIWGGEVLICSPAFYIRSGFLKPVPLPGGDKAATTPWRMAFSYLLQTFNNDVTTLTTGRITAELPCLLQVSPDELNLLASACRAGVNAPLTSSLGRLFDAIASLMDLRHEMAFEGQAAMMLEMLSVQSRLYAKLQSIAADQLSTLCSGMQISKSITGNQAAVGCPDTRGILAISENSLEAITASLPQRLLSCPVYQLDHRSLIAGLVTSISEGFDRADLALAFHASVLDAFITTAREIRAATGLNTVAISGGCWQNRILREQFPRLLREEGFDVLTHRLAPPNDGGLSLGQAYVAGCSGRVL